MRQLFSILSVCVLVLAGCGPGETGENGGGTADSTGVATRAAPACAPDNGGLTLPDGFCAVVVADGVGADQGDLRHIAVRGDGTLYVSVAGNEGEGGVIALRDVDGDGKMDEQASFGPEGGTGIEIRDGQLYFATNTAVLRYQLGDSLAPVSGPDTLVQGLPAQRGHTSKSFALGPDGELWVDIGSPTNICQPLDQDRQPGVMGEDPCTQLETRAGVWRFSADQLHQTEDAGERWATGIRNAVAITYNSADQTLYTVQHGRDQLNLWPGFSARDNAERPAEELQRVTRGANFGWPYCYYDTQLKKRVLSPEYGGDGQEVGRCDQMQDPTVVFPGHWAPEDIVFYSGQQFPSSYQGGAFVAFHGSWNRAPQPQAGYNVVFVPVQNGELSQDYTVFADGFAGPDPQPGTAAHRPMGLAVGPDGSLYITDSTGGTIWRVMYEG